jgi:cell division cycle 20-like protein 1 (cofactor of APC complex)
MHALASGSRDSKVKLTDPRSNSVQEYSHHKEEVCGLKWSHEGSCLSSGGNDNQLCVWNAAMSQRPQMQTQLNAAVKAIAWSPHQHGLLACGGGAADRRIHFYNTLTGAQLADIDTGAQVCNLLWASNVNEIVSTHGYQHNNIIIWKYPKLSTVATLTGHQSRVLWLAGSPDGQTIVTGAADETLRFWSVFPPAKPSRASTPNSALSLSIALSNIR